MPRTLLVSGIWPPDVGGPASHGPAIGAFLAERGHTVTAFASVGAPPPPSPFPVLTTSRTAPLPVRWTDAEARLLRLARTADVVYATGLYHRSAVACRVNRVPLVLKLVNDPAYERARNSGFFAGTLEDFQAPATDLRLRGLKAVRDVMLRQADRVITPSHYLADVVRTWGAARSVEVIPNPAPPPVDLPERDVLRRELGIDGPTAVFVGRLVLQKNLPLLVEAARAIPDIAVVIVGDGPEWAALKASVASNGLAGRVRLVPAVPRAAALRWMRAADVTVLPSSWENYPHAVVESLTVGTPVVATAVGGVPEIVTDGVDGLLIPDDDAGRLEAALRKALLDPQAAEQLRAGAEAVGDRFAPEGAFARAAEILEDVSRVRRV